MVGHLVRLKLALLRGGVRASGTRGTVAVALAVVFALGVGGVVGLGLSTLRFAKPSSAADTVAGAFAVLLVGWAIAPLITLTSDNTLEPDRLALLPLAIGQLMPGLLIASLIGTGGVFTIVTMAGAVIGVAPSSPAVVLTLLAAATEVALCIAASRALGTTLSSAARTRRWRDVALTIGPLAALGINLAIQVWNRHNLHRTGGARPQFKVTNVAELKTIVRWLPSGWPARAMGAAARGDPVVALGWIALTMVVVAALMWGWWRALGRLTTRAAVSDRPTSTGRSSLLPRWAPFIPATRVGAVAAKELKYVWRDPRQRVAFLAALMIGGLPLISLGTIHASSPRLVLLAAVPAFMLSVNQSNQFGYDGPAHWTNVAAGDNPRSDLVGKALARIVVDAMIVVPLAIVLAIRAGTAVMVLPALALAVAAWGVAGGFTMVASVRIPYPIPGGSTNVFSSGGTGAGFQALGTSLGTMAASALLLAPFVTAAVLLPVHSPWQLLPSVLAVLMGDLAWRIGLREATRYATAHQPEILEALSLRRAG